MKKMFIVALLMTAFVACGGKKTKTTNTTNMGSASHGSGDAHGSGSAHHDGSGSAAPTP